MNILHFISISITDKHKLGVAIKFDILSKKICQIYMKKNEFKMIDTDRQRKSEMKKEMKRQKDKKKEKETYRESKGDWDEKE